MERGQIVITEPTVAGGERPPVTVLPGSAGEHILQEKYGTTERARRFYEQQMLDHLNHRMREFVSRQEMMFVATADARGECDSTFRAGPPGFVRVLDAHRLAWPEYRGNGVMAALGNLTENGHIGLLFVDFFRDVVGLHVNGYAKLVDDDAMRAAYGDLPLDPVPGRRAERWVSVRVEEAFIHCAKHIPRLLKLPRDRAWGSDDARRKGGDFFAVESRRSRSSAEGASDAVGRHGTPRSWAGEEPAAPESPEPVAADACCTPPA